jgi:hypothetical protein
MGKQTMANSTVIKRYCCGCELRRLNEGESVNALARRMLFVRLCARDKVADMGFAVTAARSCIWRSREVMNCSRWSC